MNNTVSMYYRKDDKRHIKNTEGRPKSSPIGLIVAIKDADNSNTIKISSSLCNSKDKFNRKIANNTAFMRINDYKQSRIIPSSIHSFIISNYKFLNECYKKFNFTDYIVKLSITSWNTYHLDPDDRTDDNKFVYSYTIFINDSDKTVKIVNSNIEPLIKEDSYLQDFVGEINDLEKLVDELGIRQCCDDAGVLNGSSEITA